MPPIDLPKQFSWDWEGSAVRVDLPPIEETDTHVYEPVLTRSDAEGLAEAISQHAMEIGAPDPLPRRVTLSYDDRYSIASVAKFRERLATALETKGLRLQVDTLPTTVLASGAPEEVPPAELVAPEPVAEEPAPESEEIALPPPAEEPPLPAGFDPAGETDHGLGTTAPPVRSTPSWRRRLDKKKK